VFDRYLFSPTTGFDLLLDAGLKLFSLLKIKAGYSSGKEVINGLFNK